MLKMQKRIMTVASRFSAYNLFRRRHALLAQPLPHNKSRHRGRSLSWSSGANARETRGFMRRKP